MAFRTQFCVLLSVAADVMVLLLFGTITVPVQISRSIVPKAAFNCSQLVSLWMQ